MSGLLTYLTLPVSDLAAAATFYESTLGWPSVRRLESAGFFQLPGLTVVLMERRAFNQLVGLKETGQACAGLMSSWNLASATAVDDLIRRACAAGATLRRKAAELPWGGWAGILETPDGHLWEIVWNPRSTIPWPENNS